MICLETKRNFMSTCKDCLFTPCICMDLMDLLDENVELMNDLAELEAYERGDKRCLACQFFICKCASGHRRRLERL